LPLKICKELNPLSQSRNSPPFMVPKGSLSCSQGPAAGLWPESHECSPYSQRTPISPTRPLIYRFSIHNFVCFSHLSTALPIS
jgi:hypothetical protein